mmetsp:Transcript_11291/g.15628  ORF Transcript_11291/g.15628 Transcript_11291/m.15628 type:complete len:420 (+) Transcript_11291:59-1318(+)
MGLISARCYLICTVLVGLFAVIALVIGIAGPIYLNSTLKSGINDEILNTSKDSPAYKRWQDNTEDDAAAILMKFWIWNITNPDEVEKGANPVVQEVGPYSYREYNIYLDVSWSADQTKMNWTKWQYFVYSPEDSFEGADPYNDIFTTVNVPLMSVIGALTFNQSYETLWWKTLAYDFLASYTNEELFFQINANDLLFGYNDSMLALAASLSPEVPAEFFLQLNMTSPEDAMKYSGVNVVDTGKTDITNIGSFIQWHNSTSVGCWGNVEANTVIGNDATQFRPGIKKGDLPKVWVDQLFRMVEIQGTGDAEVKGIKVIEFTIPAEGYMNATEYPANAAYWQFWQPGVGNLTACEHGAPVFMSKPHFLDAPYFLSQVSGMNPNREKHDTFVYVEPTIGECFRAYKRLQLNIRLQPDPLLYL